MREERFDSISIGRNIWTGILVTTGYRIYVPT